MSVEAQSQRESPDIARVLVADDQVTVRWALRRLLDEVPTLALVREVIRASDLLDQAELAQPDLVLLDWELPGLARAAYSGDCGTALRAKQYLMSRLHALASHPQIIALSGQPEARWAALCAGADVFISKGDAPEGLVAALNAVATKCRSTSTQVVDHFGE